MEQSIFTEKGIAYSPLTKKEAILKSNEWVKIFFEETKRKTGKYQPTTYKWESYWAGDEPCLSGDDALYKYNENPKEPYYIIDEKGKNGFQCTSRDWPSFLGFGFDLYIFPKSLRWSMAFTHEGTCHYAESKT